MGQRFVQVDAFTDTPLLHDDAQPDDQADREEVHQQRVEQLPRPWVWIKDNGEEPLYSTSPRGG